MRSLLLYTCLLLFVTCDTPDMGNIYIPLLTTPNPPLIAIQPLGTIEPSYLKETQQAIKDFYHLDVDVLKGVPLPPSAYYQPRNRYRADSLIRYLRDTKPKKYDKIVGLTTKDISTTKGKFKDWGILGLGFCPGASCVVSTFRLKRGTKSQKKLKTRLRKVSLHELGHTLGLPHCANSDKCLMQDAKGKLSTVDNASEILCNRCWKKLKKWGIGVTSLAPSK